MKFTLEIHVETLTGETERLMYWTFEEGEDDYTMGDVLSWVKDKYTTPKNRRQELALCDRVLDDTSTDLETPIRTYLHRYCRDYNSNSTELQLRGTLIFVNNIERSDHMFVLEIHVKTSNGDTEKTMSCIYEFGEDDYTMANVMFEAKDLFPTPEKNTSNAHLCWRGRLLGAYVTLLDLSKTCAITSESVSVSRKDDGPSESLPPSYQ